MGGKPGWDEWAQRVYLTWLVRDIRYARVALAEVRGRVSQTPPDPLLWMPLETFLMFTGKVSRMLKPPEKQPPPKKPQFREAYEWRMRRGEHLRHILEIDDESPVLDRGVRNASEHFDEDLDDWIARAPRPTAEQVEAGALPSQPSPPMRRVDSSSGVVEVAGRQLDLAAIESELGRILERVVVIEPLAAVKDPGLATLMAGFTPLPRELRLDAPTRRPDESVLAGVDPEKIAADERRFDEALARLVEAFRSSPDGPGA